VLRAVDQTEVGRTPWNTLQPAANGQLVLILRYAGYADRVVTIDQSANAFVQETLQPLASSVVPTPPVDPAQPAQLLKRGKKGRVVKGPVAADGTPLAAPDKPPATPTTPTTPTKPKDETSNGRIQVVD
jgi:hypothetical protein